MQRGLCVVELQVRQRRDTRQLGVVDGVLGRVLARLAACDPGCGRDHRKGGSVE
jgi:hypothetical protein